MKRRGLLILFSLVASLTIAAYPCGWDKKVSRVCLLIRWQYNTVKERNIFAAPSYYRAVWNYQSLSIIKEYLEAKKNACEECQKVLLAECYFKVSYISTCISMFN